jgi:hypothetical protein
MEAAMTGSMIPVGRMVERAFRKIGVSSSDEPLTADQMDHGIDTLNMLLAAWRLQGVDMPLHTLAPGDPFPLQPEFQEGAVYMLASRLAPDFSVPAAFDADDYFRKIQAAFMRIDDAELPLALLRARRP